MKRNQERQSMNFIEPTFNDILSAVKNIKNIAVRTPLLESPIINKTIGGRILFKAEVLQKTGSFKFRGSIHSIASLSNAQKANGVVAFSSGNHAQGVALAANLAGIKSTIIMPKDAPDIKIRNTKEFGADIILYDRYTEDREKITANFAKKNGANIIRPYDAALTIAGQATIGVEIAEQCDELNIMPDYLLSPCGGGGLMAGLCLSMVKLLPKVKLYSIEPDFYDDTKRSLETGKRQNNNGNIKTYCDAIVTHTPGEYTFPINKKHLSGGFSVNDKKVAHAMINLFENLKLVVEPAGAVGFAALLSNKLPLQGETAVVILSGGNVDPKLFKDILIDQ